LPLHPTSPRQAHDQVRPTGQLGRLNTDYWQAEPRRKTAAPARARSPASTPQARSWTRTKTAPSAPGSCTPSGACASNA